MFRRDKINKGAPSGFVISLLVHAAAFMLAGLLVVFSVTQKKEKKFVPPKPVERPKMKLKKPKVKVKKNAKPQSSSRIVTKIDRAQMPDIQLPEMSGMSGDGMGWDQVFRGLIYPRIWKGSVCWDQRLVLGRHPPLSCSGFRSKKIFRRL